MVQRYNPDYVMHAARFAPFARENEHGEFVKFSDYEALVSELASIRQINAQTLQVKLTMAETIKELTARVNALAVENAALKANLMFWDADNPELPYDCPEEIANECELNYNDEFEVQVAARLPNRKYRVCENWEYECKLELVEGSDIETPATSAALAAIQAQGVEKFAKALRVKGDDAFFDAIAEAQANAADEFAAKLREAK